MDKLYIRTLIILSCISVIPLQGTENRGNSDVNTIFSSSFLKIPEVFLEGRLVYDDEGLIGKVSLVTPVILLPDVFEYKKTPHITFLRDKNGTYASIVGRDYIPITISTEKPPKNPSFSDVSTPVDQIVRKCWNDKTLNESERKISELKSKIKWSK